MSHATMHASNIQGAYGKPEHFADAWHFPVVQNYVFCVKANERDDNQ